MHVLIKTREETVPQHWEKKSRRSDNSNSNALNPSIILLICLGRTLWLTEYCCHLCICDKKDCKTLLLSTINYLVYPSATCCIYRSRVGFCVFHWVIEWQEAVIRSICSIKIRLIRKEFNGLKGYIVAVIGENGEWI